MTPEDLQKRTSMDKDPVERLDTGQMDGMQGQLTKYLYVHICTSILVYFHIILFLLPVSSYYLDVTTFSLQVVPLDKFIYAFYKRIFF